MKPTQPTMAEVPPQQLPASPEPAGTAPAHALGAVPALPLGTDLAPHLRPYDASKPSARGNVERFLVSGNFFLVFGWAEQEWKDFSVVLSREGKSEAVPSTEILWHWRDDVDEYLDAPKSRARRGFVIIGTGAQIDLSDCDVLVCADWSYRLAYSGAHDRYESTQLALISLYRFLENKVSFEELFFVMSRYERFLRRVCDVHLAHVSSVPIHEVFASSSGGQPAQYSICAVALGNARLLKTWMMSLNDVHPLERVEINLLCNGPREYALIEQCARWFADALGGRIRLFYCAENIGFNNGANFLVRQARSRYVLITNTDVRYLKFDLPALVQQCEIPTICVARQFNANGALQHLQLQIRPVTRIVHDDCFETVETRLLGRNTFPANDSQATSEVDFFGAACLFSRKELFDQLGPFAADYLFAYHEDSDLAWRARQKGVRLLVTSALDLVHYESSAAQTDLPRNVFIAANTALFSASLRYAAEPCPPAGTRAIAGHIGPQHGARVAPARSLQPEAWLPLGSGGPERPITPAVAAAHVEQDTPVTWRVFARRAVSAVMRRI
jgi:hypothetical protein